MSVSSLFTRSDPGRAKMFGSSSSTCFFHWVIWVGCTPYSDEISFTVFWPLIASNATFTFKSLLYFFGDAAIVFLLENDPLPPAILSHGPVQFSGTSIPPLGKLQALPKDGKAITLWRPRDDGYLNVAK